MSFRLLLLCVMVAVASAFNAPMPRVRTSSVQMSMDRRTAALTVFGGLAAFAAGADKAAAAEKKTFAEVRESSPFFSKSGLLNSIPKVKGVLLQSTNYVPTK
jgi:hypothetical protein